MKLRVLFGSNYAEEVAWWKPIDSFPVLIRYKNKNYEWFAYDKDYTGKVDTVLMFSELPTYDPNYGVMCAVWNDMFVEDNNSCKCGAKHTSFPNGHMFFCPKWSRF